MSELAIIPLHKAVLCVQCDSISNCAKDQCPACGSPSLLNLSIVLNSSKPQHAVASWTMVEEVLA